MWGNAAISRATAVRDFMHASRFSRRTFLGGIGGAAALLPVLNDDAATRPNIVFIVLDDLGYGDFGCYGQKHIKTPNVDRIAAEGTRFTDCYAGGTVCAPSRSALMSGLHTGHTWVRSNAGTVPIRKEDVTMAQVLKAAGYATGGFGKWGLGDARSEGAPTRHGFDDFFGYLHQVHAHDYYTDFLWDNDRKYPLPGNANGGRGQYSADVIAERSFEFLKKNHDKRFFLYACYTLPHAKFEVPSLAPYENEPWPEGAKTYAAMVTRADGYIGRITGMLKQYGLERNTVVFVTSDNGAHAGNEKGFDFLRSNGILRGVKTQLYEGGIRIPMIVRWPGKVKPGAVSSVPWAFWDVLPTLAEITGGKAPAGIDGISVLPVLTGSTRPPHEFLYWEAHNWNYFGASPAERAAGILPDSRIVQAVRMGDWKAVRLKPPTALELYDLEADPGEKNNVAPANPQVVARIEEYLKTARTAPRPHNTGTADWAK